MQPQATTKVLYHYNRQILTLIICVLDGTLPCLCHKKHQNSIAFSHYYMNTLHTKHKNGGRNCFIMITLCRPRVLCTYCACYTAIATLRLQTCGLSSSMCMHMYSIMSSISSVSYIIGTCWAVTHVRVRDLFY